MATAPTVPLPVRPGSFDPTLEMPAISVQPDLRSTFEGWADASQSRLTSLGTRLPSIWSGTTRWTRRVLVAIVGSPGFQNDIEGRGDGVDFLDNPMLNAEHQKTRSTIAWETWRWPRDDLAGRLVARWGTFRAGHAVEIESR